MSKELIKDIFPACFVEFPHSVEGRSCAFFLATEEYVAKSLPENNYMFFWQLSPTVVYGRNQIVHQEINIDFCKQHGIELIRRKSGGGAIFADRDNIMTSLVSYGGKVEPLFEAFAEKVAKGLRELGAPTKVSGRNDIVLEDGRKICGNAFYHLPNRNIVHCTMLYDTNIPHMMGALTPDTTKLQARGVESVRSRIGLLKEFFDFGVDELRAQLRKMLTNRSITLTADDLKAIEAIEAEYHTDEYLYGKTAAANHTYSQRFEGCGEVSMHITLRGSLIDHITMSGDFFEIEGMAASDAFNKALKNTPFTISSVRKALEESHPEQCVRNLSIKAVLALLFPENNS